jgi:hypothetical protein
VLQVELVPQGLLVLLPLLDQLKDLQVVLLLLPDLQVVLLLLPDPLKDLKVVVEHLVP